MSSRILLVEDEPGLVLTLSDLLTAEGYTVESAGDGPTGLRRAAGEEFDLVILDVMLPGKNGFDVVRDLRAQGKDVPMLMLTAKSQLVDRVVGLKLGADDYLTKPFEPEELLARVEALLRRVKKEGMARVKTFQFGSVDVDFERGDVRKNGTRGESGGQGTGVAALPGGSSRQCGLARRIAGGRVAVSARRLVAHHRCARGVAASEAGGCAAVAAAHSHRPRSGLPLRTLSGQRAADRQSAP